jgi:hypothetical protein
MVKVYCAWPTLDYMPLLEWQGLVFKIFNPMPLAEDMQVKFN